MKLEQNTGAFEDFLVVLKDEPKDAVANYQAAICLLATDRRDLARKFMQRAADAAPNSDEGHKARRWLDNEPAPARRDAVSLETILSSLVESPGTLGVAFLDPQGP